MNTLTIKPEKTWLVTGVAGFIGSHLLQALLKNNQRVIGFDNFLTGKQENIEDVLHQAALGSISRSLKDPLTTHDVNGGGF